MHLWMATTDTAPNPRRVALFCKVKGIDIAETRLDLFKGEHKSPEFLALNPRGQLPVLRLDDGRCLSETVAICRYLDEIYPEPPMFGSNAFERAETDMWIRRTELLLGSAVAGFWVHGHDFTAKLFPQIRAYGEFSKGKAGEALDWFDTQLADRKFLCGDRFSMADIVLLTTVDFAAWIGIVHDGANLAAWHKRADDRFEAPVAAQSNVTA